MVCPEAGKKHVASDACREATTGGVKNLCAEVRQFEEALAAVMLRSDLLSTFVFNGYECSAYFKLTFVECKCVNILRARQL
jgi:hypothetical protein